MNKREANAIARRLARRLDPKNAPAVDVATIKDIVIFCHAHGVELPADIRGLCLVKVLLLAIENNQLSGVTMKPEDMQEIVVVGGHMDGARVELRKGVNSIIFRDRDGQDVEYRREWLDEKGQRFAVLFRADSSKSLIEMLLEGYRIQHENDL